MSMLTTEELERRIANLEADKLELIVHLQNSLKVLCPSYPVAVLIEQMQRTLKRMGGEA